MKTHILTHHSTKEERKNNMKYYCDKCDFGTNAEILFKRHLETQKHLN
jgi:ribosomal protein L35